MMKIWKYDDSNKLTHLSMVEVDNNHELLPDELKTIPVGFLTPAKLVNGVLTSASEKESSASVSADVIPVKPSADQLIQSNLIKEVADLKKQVADLTAKVGGADKDVSSN